MTDERTVALPPPNNLCKETDDRTPSNDVRMARVFPSSWFVLFSLFTEFIEFGIR